jgi:hypothetical protein
MGITTNSSQGKHFGHHKAASGGPTKSGVQPMAGTVIKPGGTGSGSSGGSGSGGGSPPPKRSGSGLGSPGGGYNCQGGGGTKTHAPQAAGFSAVQAGKNVGLLGDALPFMPDTATFYPSNADIHNFHGNGVYTGNYGFRGTIDILITGSPLEGLRSRGANTEGYTHIALADPNTQINDYYASATGGVNSTGDYLAIPSGSGNYWIPVFSCVSNVPGLGRRLILYLDRKSVSTWSALV